MSITTNMTNEEVAILNQTYALKEELSFPDDFDHRVDPDSSRVLYSFVREYQPTSLLEIGTWNGGSTLTILRALLKNDKPFNFVASELLLEKFASTIENCVRNCGTRPTMIGDITQNLRHVQEELDFLMVDTDHDLKTTKWILKNIFPRLKDGALVVFHDWAVEDKNGVWTGKNDAWPETQYMIDLHKEGKLPLEKVYWNYMNPDKWETGVFLYKKP